MRTVAVYKVDAVLGPGEADTAVEGFLDPVIQEAALGKLVSGARGNENTMPLVMDCVRAYATVGEICHALKPVFGEYREVSVF